MAEPTPEQQPSKASEILSNYGLPKIGEAPQVNVDANLASAAAPKVESGKETEVETPQAQVNVDADDISDEKLLAQLRKKGLKIDSLEDLNKETPKTLTKEEQDAADQDLKDKAIEYGLKTKAFNSTELAKFNSDKNVPAKDIAYEAFKYAQKEADKDVTDEDILERFNDRFGIDQEEGSWKQKAGAAEMESIKSHYINSKYEKILGIDGAFKEKSEIEQQAVAYKGTIDNVFKELPKAYEFDLKDDAMGDKKYNFTYTPELLKLVQDELLKEESFRDLFVGKKMNAEQIKFAATKALESAAMPHIIREIANAYKSDAIMHEKLGRKGVIEAQPNMGQENHTPNLAPRATQKMKDVGVI